MPNLKSLSGAAYLVLLAATVYLLIAHHLFAPSPVGISLQVAAILLMVWARITFGRRSFHLIANPTEGRLVTTGPYRFIRHPIYSAILLFVTVAVVSYWSWMNALVEALTIAAVLTRALCEEKLLRENYPQYAGYAARTRRLIPFIY